MDKIKWLSAATVALLICFYIAQAGQGLAQEDPTQDYLSAARDVLQAARTAVSRVGEFCAQDVDCSGEIINQLNAARQGIDSLSGLLVENPPNLAAIRAVVASLSQALHPICDQLGGQCSTLFGAANGEESPTADLPNDYGHCFRGAAQARRSCYANVDDLSSCWLRTPFCDWPGFPFDAASFSQSCGPFISSGLLPSCRCQCPQSERQGGCPQFFERGLMCADCSTNACQRGGDPRCSCKQEGDTFAKWNWVACDLCRWSNIGLTISDLRRKVCERRYLERVDDCRDF